MFSPPRNVIEQAKEKFGDYLVNVIEAADEVTLEIDPKYILNVCRELRDNPNFSCDQLIDICGVDYLHYGKESVAGSRKGPRFAVVYHLLAIKYNFRIRIRAFLDEEFPVIDSVVGIWNSANWYEREAFDMFGIVFEDHPDLRRILTDYGFIGHPFRKDFPLSGHVEMRYDPEKRRVVYQPVSIEERTLVPRVIREEGYGG